MAPNTLSKPESDYVGQVFVPGFDKLLKELPWFANACAEGLHCDECPSWLAEYLCAEGLDRAKILALLRVPEMQGRICRLMHAFKENLGISMSDAADADWGFRMDSKEMCSETSAKIIGIVKDGAVAETICLYRDPAPAIAGVDRVVQLDLHDCIDLTKLP